MQRQPFAEGKLEWADVPAKEVRDERTEKTTLAGTTKYTYNVLGQLIQENNHIYTYDCAGNRTSVTFSKDKSMDDRSLWDIARISDRPGPISISNVKIIGFKKQKKWWQFWKK